MSFARKLPLIAVLAAAPALASAFSYDYVEAGFGEFDIVKGTSDNGDALYLGGAMDLNKQFGLLGSFGVLDYGPVNGNGLRFGGMFHTPLKSAQKLDFVGTAEILYLTWDAPAGVDDDETGMALSGGLRYEVQDNFLVEGKLTYTDIGNDAFDDGVGISVDGRYYVDKKLSLALGLANDTEYDGIWMNIRYDLK